MSKKNVGVIGNGRWAKIILPKIGKFANIKFIANTKTGYKKFKLDKISWVFVLTNNKSHLKIVKYFINKKKNVFCEKPLTNHFSSSLKLFELSKKKKVKLYVNDVEVFKKKKLIIKDKNIIIRKKKSLKIKESLLHRLAYHDFYLVRKYINLDDVKVKQYKETKKNLLIKIISGNKSFEFIYDINSNFRKHKINKIDMMKYSKDPLEMMVKYILFNKNSNFTSNFYNSTFSSKLISKINKNFY